MATKSFHLGDILSVTTGRLVSQRLFDGPWDLCSWMTGENLFNHQLIRAVPPCGQELLRQHPQLVGAELPDEFDGEAHVRAWLDEQVTRFGCGAAATRQVGAHRPDRGTAPAAVRR
jgi:hypothetical protein